MTRITTNELDLVYIFTWLLTPNESVSTTNRLGYI